MNDHGVGGLRLNTLRPVPDAPSVTAQSLRNQLPDIHGRALPKTLGVHQTERENLSLTHDDFKSLHGRIIIDRGTANLYPNFAVFQNRSPKYGARRGAENLARTNSAPFFVTHTFPNVHPIFLS